MNSTKYTLMHKNIPVAELDIDEETGAISKIAEVHSLEHLPVGIEITGGRPNRQWLNGWWSGRSIPATRSGLREALDALKVSSPLMLLTKCFGLSLSDQYWVRSKAQPVEWKDVNFFDNPFSEDVGNALFGRDTGNKPNLMSPDNTSDGWLKKKWVISGDKRMLVKSGSPVFHQEPLNEALATAIARRLGIPHIPYSVIYEDGKPLCVCEDFITPDTELISASYVMGVAKLRGSESPYRHYVSCCERLGIPGVVQSIDRMLVLDFLLCNQDRHYNNFGAVRNAETLEWLGAAPIFDCGTSVWHNVLTNMIRPREEAQSKPFRSKHSEQIRLVTDFSWVDVGALKGIGEEFAEILRPSEYIDGERRSALCKAVDVRVKMLESIVAEWRMAHKPSLLGKLAENKQKSDMDKSQNPLPPKKPELENPII